MYSGNLNNPDQNKRAGYYASPVDRFGASSQNYNSNGQFSQENYYQGQGNQYQGHYPSYGQGAQQQQPVMVQPSTLNPVVINPGTLQGTGMPIVVGRKPQSLFCPYCNQFIHTTVDSNPTSSTHLYAMLLCLLCGVCCCCCVPYCVDSCQSQQHFCPNCKNFLGEHTN